MKPLLAILAVLAAPSLLAAQDSVVLQPIVVTGARLPQPLDHVAGAMTVLDGAQLRQRGVTQLIDALREVPGLHLVQSGGPGTVASLFVRGGESDYVRVLLDGMPINQPGGSVDLSGLSLDNIQRIEILRGPASVLYGSDAIGGVVHIITRSGIANLVNAEVRAGRYGTTEGRVDASAARGAWMWSGAASRSRTDGIYELNSRWTSTNVSGAVGTAGSVGDVKLTGRLGSHRLRYPTDFTGAPTDSNQFSRGEQRDLALDAGRSWSRLLETRLLLGWHGEDLETNNLPDSPAETDSSRNETSAGRLQADVRINVRPSRRVVLTAGGTAERQEFANRLTFGGSFPGGDTIDARRSVRAGYLQALIDAGPATITLGTRYEESRGSGSVPRRLHSAATWRAGANVRAGAMTRLRFAAGSAFKEPTFFEQLGGGFGTGNPALEPERSLGAEAGVDHTLMDGRLRVSATAFVQRFRDMVQYTFAVAPGEPNYSNISGARSRGLELDGRLDAGATGIWTRLTLLSTMVTDSSPDGSTFAEGQRLLRRPSVSVSAGVERRHGRALVSLAALVTGKRDDLDFVNSDPVTFQPRRVTLPAYVRLDAGGRLALRSGLSLTMRIENLLDQQYEEVLYYPARGRTLLAGASLSLGGGN